VKQGANMEANIVSTDNRIHDTHAFRVALCTGIGEMNGRSAVQVELGWDDGPPRWATRLRGVSIRVGDQVLLAPLHDAKSWIAVGALAAARERATLVLLPASGYQLEGESVGGEDYVRLRDANGGLKLELKIADGRTHLCLPTRDAVLECDGNLEVRAGESIR